MKARCSFMSICLQVDEISFVKDSKVLWRDRYRPSAVLEGADMESVISDETIPHSPGISLDRIFAQNKGSSSFA